MEKKHPTSPKVKASTKTRTCILALVADGWWESRRANHYTPCYPFSVSEAGISSLTRGVTVSTSAFLACHQCGFEFRLGLELSGFSMWHFLKLVVRGFLQFPPLLHRLMVKIMVKIKLK